MGIRANALTDHQVPDYHNQAAVISLLKPTLPAIEEVSNYWKSVQPNDFNTIDAWSAYFIQNPKEGDYLRYDGPAGFSVRFGKQVARISGPCRWSGFATMAALQKPHVVAFWSIARAIGGRYIVLTPDFDPVEEIAIYDGVPLEQCISLLNEKWGSPQPATQIVTDDVEIYYRRKSPPWFVEKLNDVSS